MIPWLCCSHGCSAFVARCGWRRSVRDAVVLIHQEQSCVFLSLLTMSWREGKRQEEEISLTVLPLFRNSHIFETRCHDNNSDFLEVFSFRLPILRSPVSCAPGSDDRSRRRDYGQGKERAQDTRSDRRRSRRAGRADAYSLGQLEHAQRLRQRHQRPGDAQGDRPPLWHEPGMGRRPA